MYDCCGTILELSECPIWQTQGEKDEAKVKQEKYQQDIQRLTAEYRALSGLFHRNHKMRMVSYSNETFL